MTRASSATLRLEARGPATLQDAGRVGAMRFGVSQSGPMDRLRFMLATAIAGDTAVAFEIGLPGATVVAEGAPVRLGIAGTGFLVTSGDGERMAAPLALVATPGERVEIVPGRAGMWAYVAASGLDPGRPMLGSFATNARTGLGTRDLSAAFPVTAATPAAPLTFSDPVDDEGSVAILEGPQSHLFEPEVRETLTGSQYALSSMVDRMGYRLDGPQLAARTHDIVSDGIVEGAIQVPGDGRPIVLCADRAPTGGYPKIAVVARADRHRITQRRPGDIVRFVWQDEAVARRRWRELSAAVTAPRPRVRTALSPEFLAEQTLVDGVWSGDAEEPR